MASHDYIALILNAFYFNAFTLTEEQIQNPLTTVAESVNLQRLAWQRQRTITMIAIPGILVCVAAIASLVIRYL